MNVDLGPAQTWSQVRVWSQIGIHINIVYGILAYSHASDMATLGQRSWHFWRIGCVRLLHEVSPVSFVRGLTIKNSEYSLERRNTKTIQSPYHSNSTQNRPCDPDDFIVLFF